MGSVFAKPHEHRFFIDHARGSEISDIHIIGFTEEQTQKEEIISSLVRILFLQNTVIPFLIACFVNIIYGPINQRSSIK